MLVGITGKSGSGKTTMSKRFKEYDFTIINVDEVAHRIMEDKEIRLEIEKEFDVNLSYINRVELGDMVFNNRTNMKRLTDLIGSRVISMIEQLVNENKNGNCVVEWILLPKTDLFNKCDIKILLAEDDFVRKARVMSRDGISEEYYNARESNSIDYNVMDFHFILSTDQSSAIGYSVYYKPF